MLAIWFEQQPIERAFDRLLAGSIDPVAAKWVLRCKELGECSERPFVRWKHTIAGPGTEGVKVHQVTHQGDIQYFSDLLEIIIFVHQFLEGLRRVVGALVGPIRRLFAPLAMSLFQRFRLPEKRVGLEKY